MSEGVRVEDLSGVTRISFPGTAMLDSPTIQRIGQELYDIVDRNGSRKIILDFGDIRFMSSQALGVLLTLRRKAEKSGASVVLTRIQEKLYRVFQITNLDKLFPAFGTNEEALQHLGAGGGPSD